ncbi:MAG: CYTH domain-containing protein [Erysipelotrichaceae bacterium]|nr:CYTH domain-containing protein [Erysipelotrichaceae bacterium]
MNKNIEKELKILVSKEKFYELLSFYPQLSFKKQVNVYYDTKDHQILNHYGAMRIRTKDHHIFTFKKCTSQGLEEYECSVDQNSSDMLLKEPIASFLQSQNLFPPFYEIASLCTYRGVIETEYAELCFDINEYNGITDYEIEYEYKKEHDGISLFNNILSKVQLSYEENCPAKIKRAMINKK